MKRKTIEQMALTLREQEAELEAAANAQPLGQLIKTAAARKAVHRIRIERMPLTDREQEAEAEIEKRELGVILPL